MATRKKPLTPEEKARRAEMTRAFYLQELAKPLEYFLHDACASKDQDMLDLIDELGKEAYASFWLLIELLAKTKNHRYRVLKDSHWKHLAQELKYDTIEETRKFIEVCCDLGIVNKAMYLETKHIQNNRLIRNAELKAEEVATMKMLGVLSGEKRRQKPGENTSEF